MDVKTTPFAPLKGEFIVAKNMEETEAEKKGNFLINE